MIKKIIGISSILILITNTALSDGCPAPVQKIEKGAPASCSGYLFSPEKESELYRINEQNKIYKELVPKLEEKNNLTEQRLKLYQDYSHDLEKDLHDQQFKSDAMKVVYFLSGALLMYGTYKVVNANK